MNKLDPIAMPLSGTNLIEASAGTGKTYTITSLYLRLLLGLAQPGEINEGLSVEQILVVTFTEAATEEIRDRVRTRLSDAKLAIFLRGLDPDLYGYKPDPLMAQLLEIIDDHQLAYRRLDAAIKMMDEACIFTIHGFCQRMLKFHAFESGSLFDSQFILDEKEYLQGAIKDYWRRTVYPMSGLLLKLFLKHWSRPDKLLADLMPLLNKQAFRPLTELDEAGIAACVAEYEMLITEVKQLWLDDRIPALINESTMMPSRKPAKPEYLEAFTEFCLSDEDVFSANKGKDSWELWSSEAVKKACKKGTEPPQHRIWLMFEKLSALQAQLNEQLYAHYRYQAYEDVKTLLQQQKRLAQKISPDDLLNNLASALRCGKKGEALASRIASQFPVAMIDEFQDTDPQQYYIFSSIYNTEDAIMIMIGDPKQAIYGFRGADIFTYIQAKNDVAPQSRYTLDTNWRSASNLVSAVNGLFSQSQNAFIYNDAIEFYAVHAATKADAAPLVIADESKPSALKLWHLIDENDVPLSKTSAANILAHRTANEIAELLQKAKAGQAHIGERMLDAGDICVLVRDRNEADIMRQALKTAAIASVYLSRQSVFETSLAREFYLLLLAIHQGKNEKAIRAALTTSFFGYSFNRLWTLSQNEDDWQTVLDLFLLLNNILHKNGVMAVFQYLLLNNNLAGRWKSSFSRVQRMLTDMRHMCELLQQKSQELDGINRLLSWFHEQLLSVKDEGKVQQLRLEDDAHLVQIVTMHASKGLEYNVVFMPFVCGYRSASSGLYHDDEGLVIDFANGKESLVKADKERLAEDLRLLYVALTRAVHRCYVGVFNLKVGNAKASHLLQTALGYLLFNGVSEINNQAVAERLDEICLGLNQSNTIAEIETLTGDMPQVMFDALGSQQEPVVFKSFNGTIEYDWRVTSYSALAHNTVQVVEKPGSTDEGEIIVPEPVDNTLQQIDRFTFPKGANAGSCLHEILENIEFTEFVKGKSDSEAIEAAFAKYGIDEQYVDITEQWMVSLLNTRLNRKGLKLNAVAKQHRLVEMEFYLPMARISPNQINEVLSQHLDQKVEAFNFAEVKGVLKGYIDLVFQWQGQYYILDYKSNHLGDSVDDYEKDAMEQAMDGHHYHLQYLLYTLALHRFLKQRLPDYDYDRHFGGNYYLFLRGMDEKNSHFEGVYFSKPDKALVESMDVVFKLGERRSDDAGSPEQLGLFGGF